MNARTASRAARTPLVWAAHLVTLALLAAPATGCARRDPDPPPIASVVSRAVERAAVRARLAAHRAQQIERLHAYGERGEFPRQTSRVPLHVFRDDAGRLCAVANLIEKDGRGDLVLATARARNDLAVADVEEGPIVEWALASGLTKEEVVRIQAPAPALLPARTPQPAPVRPADVAKNDAVRAFPPVSVPEMTAAIRAHVREVEAELRAGTERSLDVAVDRVLATPASGIAGRS
jgi:hypothetical protein